jgi:hypothetical protein
MSDCGPSLRKRKSTQVRISIAGNWNVELFQPALVPASTERSESPSRSLYH